MEWCGRNWASSQWLGAPAVDPVTGPVDGDSIFYDGGNITTALNGVREVDNVTRNSPTVTTWTLQAVSDDSSLNAESIVNTGTGHLAFRAAVIGVTMELETINLLQASTGQINLGNLGASNRLNALTISGTTSVSSGSLNINVDNNDVVNPDTYTVGLLNVSGGIVRLNQVSYVKSGTVVANSSGLIGSGGEISNGDNAGGIGNASSLVVTNTANHSSGTVLSDGTVGTLSLTKSGTGNQTLTADSTYTGGTTITAGTLLITSANGVGTGAVSIAAGTLHVNALSGTAAIANTITVTDGNGSYVLERANGTNFSSLVVSSDIAGGQDTTASILSGTASTARTLTSGFDTAPSVSATNDGVRVSDVFSLDGTGTDIFVLQLQIADVASGEYLGWLNGSDTWVNAVDGNTATGGIAVTDFAGSFASSGASATSDYLGSWGYDTTGNTVWAVLDHNSEFAVVPEPSTVFLAVVSLGVFALFGAKRRKLARVL